MFSTFGSPLFTPERFDVGSNGDTYILTPSLVNQFLVGMHRTTSNQNYNNVFTYSSLGASVPAQVDAYPAIDIIDPGIRDGHIFGPGLFPGGIRTLRCLVRVKGEHRFIFGGELTRAGTFRKSSTIRATSFR